MRGTLTAALLGLIGLVGGIGGCASSPPLRTGFISNYSSLERIDDTKARYVSLALARYQSFMVDPVQFRAVKDRRCSRPTSRPRSPTTSGTLS